jgi:membrane protein implicated in regulation of membrane protease activity
VRGELIVAVSVSGAPFWFWWLVPVVATPLVVLVVALARRDRHSRDSEETVADYDRFRTTMNQVRKQRAVDPREDS